MIKKIFAAFLIIGFAFVLWNVMSEVDHKRSLSGVSYRYADEGPEDLGAMNLVTAIIVTYRGLDTLGEVAVLFTAASGVGMLLRRRKKEKETNTVKDKRASSEILFTGAHLLVPVMVMFGVYIFINGHLSPGGGFQGGAVIASAVLLLFLADRDYNLSHAVFGSIESASGVLYVTVGLLGLFLAGGFLDNRFLPLGEFGSILSAGAIPVIYSLIGLKVGTELAGILDSMKKEGK